MINSSLKRSDIGLARVNEGSHCFYLPPTRLSTSGMNSPAAEHHRTLAGTHFPSRWG